MSWETDRYLARCEQCGREGVCVRRSDDWGRTETLWEGFAASPPSATAVARGRSGARDLVATCACGSMGIGVHELLPPTSN